MLFDEQDCRENLPKAAAAERKLRQINSDINITGIVTDINPANVEDLIKGADVVVDRGRNAIAKAVRLPAQRESAFALGAAALQRGARRSRGEKGEA